MADKIYENDNYYVTKGVVRLEGGVTTDGYHCVNKQTQIVETEDTILPQIVSFANAASDHLDDLFPRSSVDVSIQSH